MRNIQHLPLFFGRTADWLDTKRRAEGGRILQNVGPPSIAKSKTIHDQTVGHERELWVSGVS